MKRFNDLDMNYTQFYSKKNYENCINIYLDINGWNETGKRETKTFEYINQNRIKELDSNTYQMTQN